MKKIVLMVLCFSLCGCSLIKSKDEETIIDKIQEGLVYFSEMDSGEFESDLTVSQLVTNLIINGSFHHDEEFLADGKIYASEDYQIGSFDYDGKDLSITLNNKDYTYPISLSSDVFSLLKSSLAINGVIKEAKVKEEGDLTYYKATLDNSIINGLIKLYVDDFDNSSINEMSISIIYSNEEVKGILIEMDVNYNDLNLNINYELFIK